MNSNLTDELRNVINNSCRHASALLHREVSSGTLLIGMINTECSAANILKGLGIEGPAIVSDIAKMEGTAFTGTTEELQQRASELSSSSSFLSEESMRLIRIAKLEARRLGADSVGSEHLLLGILHDQSNMARTFLNNKGVTFRHVLDKMNIRPGVRNAFGLTDEEDEPPTSAGNNPQGNGGGRTVQKEQYGGETGTPMLDRFGVDLTQKAEKGVLDPVVGRQREIERMTQILCRRKKNNPILIGQPGVGKSAICEGLATLIATRKAPHALLDKRIVALDMAAVVAGTQYRGQFEERLRKLIEELKTHKEVILFIDEIHTIIGAGSAAGTLDAANILKPALARGEVQCIGATTIDEYRKTIEKDGALERRFQKIMVEPSSAEETLEILQNLRSRYEEHHSVRYTDEALQACVTLTARYVTDRCLPDKAIDAMDEAGSRVHLSSVNVPKEIRDKEEEIEALKLQKAKAAKKQDYELAANLRDAVSDLTRELDQMTTDWMNALNGHSTAVSADDIAEVVSLMCGVPAGKMNQTENERLRGLKGVLTSKVIAQDEAVEKLVRAITMSRIGLKGENRPIGTFMFVGPTGVGKTHLVKTLARTMFDSDDALIRIDMSEYGEKYSTSRLVGAPPGYVGYEEGGQLTERVRRHPYSVILLDEIEKAHPDVFNTLLQVMDEGRMTDGNGTTVDFRNTIIVMTSNSGTRQLGEYGKGIGFNAAGGSPAMADAIIRKALKRQFAPEFLNRLDDIIVFRPLTTESAGRIARIELEDLRTRMLKIGLDLDITDELVNFIVSRGFDAQYGARSLKRAIKEHVEDTLCDAMMSDNPPTGKTRFEVKEDKLSLTA